MSRGYDIVIPFELQIEIMKRLPIKSLMKFRSVSKPWKSIINTSEFISDYNKHTHHSNPRQLLLGSIYNNDAVYILNDDDDDDSLPSLKCSLALPSSVKPPWIRLIGYSQGLFGFFNYDKYYTDEQVVVIWNPSIRKSVSIPVPNVLDWPSGSVVGFGVCNATDPMIVKINFIPWEVEVYKLSTGVWRILSNSNYLPRISLHLRRSGAIVIHNFIYWLAFDECRLDVLIFSFEMTSEEFKEITLPPIFAHTGSSNLELFKLRESLVLLHTKWGNTFKYDVWMREDGVQNSFRKLYSVKKPDISIQMVIGFRNNGQPIFKGHVNDKPRLFVYQPDLERFNDIGISGIKSSLPVCSYMGTLLLLDQ